MEENNTNIDIDISENIIKNKKDIKIKIKDINDLSGNLDISGNQTNSDLNKVINDLKIALDAANKRRENKLDKLSYQTVDKLIKAIYSYKENASSTALDILAVYFKGQKVLYTEAKSYCENQLYKLMFPAIFITTLCSVLSLVLESQNWGSILVASLNGINAFILSIISLLCKLTEKIHLYLL